MNGAVQHEPLRSEHAEHGIEEPGEEATGRHHREPGPGEAAQHLVPCAPMGPRCGKLAGLLRAAGKAAREGSFHQASIPCGIV